MPFHLPLLLLLLLGTSTAQGSELLHYPRHSQDVEPEAYALELLEQALAHHPGRYRLQATARPMTQSRALHALQHDTGAIQVMWTMTTQDREDALRAIRIPIDKGLIGWRIALLRSGQEQLLAQVHSLEQLHGLRFGQRHDWPDTEILRSNGLTVVTSPNYDGLFEMLAARRFELFPRELVVAWDELQRAQDRGLALSIDPHLVIHYPTAFYFFTSRQREDLARDIEAGLEAMLADGRFEQLFQANHGPSLRRADLPSRQLIRLHNPQLPAGTPLERQELWFNP